MLLATFFLCTAAQVWDGDSFTCSDGTKVRVAGVAAREIKRVNGRMVDAGCSPGHPCPATDAVTARDGLVALLGRPIGVGPHGHVLVAGKALRCVSNGSAGRGRIGAWCDTPEGLSISCAMVQKGYALRWSKFDRGRRLCAKF